MGIYVSSVCGYIITNMYVCFFELYVHYLRSGSSEKEMLELCKPNEGE